MTGIEFRTLLKASCQMDRLLKEAGVEYPEWSVHLIVLTGIEAYKGFFLLALEDPKEYGRFHYWWFDEVLGECVKYYTGRELPAVLN